VSVWAFEHVPGETGPVIQAEPAYYVFRLDSLIPAGVPPLAQIREEVLHQARLEKKASLWRAKAEEIAAALKSSPSLLNAGTARGLQVQRLGPFTRLRPPPILQLEPKVLGEAFGLSVGERSGVIVGEHRAFIIQGLARVRADSSAWLKQKDTQRDNLLQTVRQARVESFLAALHSRAKIVDRRKEIFRPQNATAGD
jgi:peptidyl-prolyl cis-trans isomerase D